MADARYELVLLDESGARIALTKSITVGRHIDNDLVIAGEDVRDFHLRIEATARGPRVVVLTGATVHRNTIAVEGAAGLRPGDELVLGRHRLRVEVIADMAPCSWRLFRIGHGDSVAVDPIVTVGRAGDCDLQLADDHISRHHARVGLDGGIVWVEELGSANGTFVNGIRLSGATRLFHGDEVAFDTVRFQLIGDAPDLTPIRPPGQPPDQLDITAVPVAQRAPRTETATVRAERVETPRIEARPIDRERLPTPPMLVGTSPPIAGREFPLEFGRHLIGRGPDADIAIEDASVSLRHAEVELQPDGARLVNLMSTNGTSVNGVEMHACGLRDGDVVRIGRVTLEFHAARSAAPRWLRHKWIVGVGAGILVAALLAAWWLLR